MLKEVLASNVAKLIAGCVCPVVGVGAIALNVPKIRSAVHKATAPKPVKEARAKPRVRMPTKAAIASDLPEDDVFEAGLMCPQPVSLGEGSLQSTVLTQPDVPVRIDPGPTGADCGPVRTVGGGVMSFRFAAVPEPATWAQMIAGFGLLGATLRLGRRRQSVETRRA